MPEIRELSWDSGLFGFPVGRIDVCAGDVEVGSLENAVKRGRFKLTYVFLPVQEGSGLRLEPLRKELVNLGGRMVDRKLTYRKELTESPKMRERCKPVVRAMKLTASMERLSLASGWCSRFWVDEKLRDYLGPMYVTWLRRDFERGVVFVCPSCENPEGMVTASVLNGVGRYGLVVVEDGHRREGVGASLLENVESWFHSCGVHRCEVVTQAANVGGVRFYERCGFALTSCAEVWHVWQ